MNAKEWLDRARKLNDEIDELEDAKLAMYDRATSITPSYSGGRVSGTKDHHIFDDYVMSCDEIDNRFSELIEIKREIQSVIFAVDNIRYRTLLLARHINYRKFNQIADDMGYSREYVMRLYGKAVEAVDDILNNKGEDTCVSA